jgi:hypothetical protein
MARRRANPWLRIGLDAWAMGVEASAVVGLRTLKIAAGGPAGQAEAQEMLAEKVQAAVDWQMKAMTGGLGFTPSSAAAKTLTHYRRKVRANRRRLSKI